MQKQFVVEFESDVFDKNRYNCKTSEYGSFDHFGGNASTIKSAKSVIRNLRKLYAVDNPRNFRVFDCFADIDPETNHAPCIYLEE